MDTRNFTYMVYAFTAVWLILFGYVVSLAARQRGIRREMETLRQMVREREHK